MSEGQVKTVDLSGVEGEAQLTTVYTIHDLHNVDLVKITAEAVANDYTLRFVFAGGNMHVEVLRK
jgi:hypothetical protein